ncbi:SDR family NAD(P)-dependent oxidoreductase [Streptomyces sp. NPDC018833]|uniref:SDR family NAD(P)-dependent oxidoreductase n=1 Tax=Streptomyces sp. NPDC018833 TaxID=3365053 RepID=UPI00378AD13C
MWKGLPNSTSPFNASSTRCRPKRTRGRSGDPYDGTTVDGIRHGASSGFGVAIARRFAAAGARVIISGRRGDKLADVAADLGPLVLPLVLDVRDREAVDSAMTGLPDDFSSIDLLVNNAGLAMGLEPAHQADLDDWMTMLDVVKALFRLSRAVPGGRSTPVDPECPFPRPAVGPSTPRARRLGRRQRRGPRQLAYATFPGREESR